DRAEVVALRRAQSERTLTAFHLVHRVVRLAHERAGIALLVTDGHAEARGQLQLVGDALRSCKSFVLVRLGEDDRELVAADTKGVVAGADRRAQSPGYALQRLVTRRVTLGVVHGLQLVHVEHDERERPGVAPAPRHLRVEMLYERAPVEQVRQR